MRTRRLYYSCPESNRPFRGGWREPVCGIAFSAPQGCGCYENRSWRSIIYAYDLWASRAASGVGVLSPMSFRRRDSRIRQQRRLSISSYVLSVSLCDCCPCQPPAELVNMSYPRTCPSSIFVCRADTPTHRVNLPHREAPPPASGNRCKASGSGRLIRQHRP